MVNRINLLKKISIAITLLVQLLSASPVFAKTNDQGAVAANIAKVSVSANQDYAAAIPLLHAIARKHAEQGEVDKQLDTLTQIADAQAALGNEKRMLRTLQHALNIAQQQKRYPQILVLQSRLATAYLYSADFAKAQELFVALSQNHGFKENIGLQVAVLNDRGNLTAYQGNYEQALSFYRQSADLAAAHKDSLAQLRALSNAVSAAQLANSSEADALFGEAMRILPSLLDEKDMVPILFRLAKSMQSFSVDSAVYLSNIRPLITMLASAVRGSGVQVDHGEESLLYGALADLYEQAEQNKDALVYSERAMFAAQQAGDLGLLYQSQWQQARLYNRMGRADDSLRAYRLAVQSLQPIKDRITDSRFRRRGPFPHSDGSIYLEFADQLLKSTDTLQGKTERQQRLVEARQTMEMQKEAELQDYFRDSCLTNAKANISVIDEAIGPRTAIIYPILLADRTELLVSFKDGIQRYVVDKSAQQVTEQVRALRTKLEKRRTRDYLPYSQRLYKWLIEPLEVDLHAREINTLVMVSGQSLRTIPLSVFHDGEQFLVNRYALATTPGLTLTDASPLKRKNMRVLLSGITESVQGYPALNYVRGELEEIQDLYVGKLLLNRDFVTASLGNAMQASDYSVTHIASHSVFTGDIQNSYILTFDGHLTMNQLGDLASISRKRNKPIELITLSACQTAAGDDRAALGLAGVAIKSGARSALATLWSINDQASSLLVTEFYRQLQDASVSKAEALQRAQTKLMSNVRYRHPGYWSPFLLIGNWL